MNLRWTGDTRGEGVASAESLVPALDRLRAGMMDSTWVAEEPEAHLLPHIIGAVERYGRGLSLASATVEDAVLVVVLRHGSDANASDIRTAAFSILGSFAEANTFVREDRHGEAALFTAVTGMLDGDGQFAGHGHIVRLVIEA